MARAERGKCIACGGYDHNISSPGLLHSSKWLYHQQYENAVHKKGLHQWRLLQLNGKAAYACAICGWYG
eukprot:2919907-Amphidinium_carterae.1